MCLYAGEIQGKWNFIMFSSVLLASFGHNIIFRLIYLGGDWKLDILVPTYLHRYVRKERHT